MPNRNPAVSVEFCSSYGTNLLDHLAADGAGFAGGQVAVVAVGQVDTDFLGSLHLELVHSLTSLGDIDLIVVLVAHFGFSPSFICRKAGYFPDGKYLISFRGHSLTSVGICISGEWRKGWKRFPVRKPDVFVGHKKKWM